MRQTFKSLAHFDIGYAYDSKSDDYRAAIQPHFRVFQTFGDGLTQHSVDSSVNVDLLADYLLSLTAAMLVDHDLAKEMQYTLSQRPTEQALRFAATVIYRPGKTRYFSLDQLKISASDSKRHDKRYIEMNEAHDGSPRAMLRVLTPEYAHGFQVYATAEAVRDWLMRNDQHAELPACLLKWLDEDRDRARELHRAYTVCCGIAESARLRENAEREIENYQHRSTAQAEAA